jgi:hypothetical protein
VPILTKSIGWDRPQYRVRKSTCSRGHGPGLTLAMHASEEAD